MSLPQIAFVAREFVRQRLEGQLGQSTSFNPNHAIAAATYGVAPMVLSTTSNPATLMLGRFKFASLVKACMAGQFGFPIVILSIANDDMVGRGAMRVTPSTYSGPIFISIDFWVEHPERIPGDGDAIYCAIEDALMSTFNSPDSYGLMPQGLTYNNEIRVDNGEMEFDGTRWLQLISAFMVFYRIT